MTQRELGRKLGVGNSIICRIESGERWPPFETWDHLWHLVRPADRKEWRRLVRAQRRTWRAYAPARKGKTP